MKNLFGLVAVIISTLINLALDIGLWILIIVGIWKAIRWAVGH